jgi:hypothetical protein
LVLFHSPHKSKRLSYVLNYLFTERLGIPYELLESVSNIVPPDNVTINYSQIPLENAWNFIPDGLLNTSQILPISNNYLPADSNDSPFNNKDFDVFSAIFFHLSRYEEYVTKKRDEHGRFHYADSVIFQKSFLKTPFIDQWIEQFKHQLIEKYHYQLSDFKSSVYYNQATIDVDSVFAYKAKSLPRQLAAILRDCFSGRFSELITRLKVLLGKQRDPNDNFDWQLSALGKNKACYFIQSGPYGPYDKNISPLQKDFTAILHQLLSAGHSIGLHPSYGSDSRPAAIASEKHILETATGQSVNSSRQHFLKMDLPLTYRALIKCGINTDYSMGYSHVPGFRAGTAHPFKWFDLELDTETALLIQPFCCMDVAYKQFMHLSVDACIEDSSAIKQTLKKLNAPFVFVFHNESLSGHRGWQNWDRVFNYWLHDKN